VDQAQAALKQYNDVMEAAERIFDGAFDDIPDEGGATSVPSTDPNGDRMRCPPTMRLVVCTNPRELSPHSYKIIDSGRRRRFRGSRRKWRRRQRRLTNSVTSVRALIVSRLIRRGVRRLQLGLRG
jgi:hypothetical protein